MKVELRQLRHVLAIERHRNFARAAEALALTQPALTRSLQSLESDLGARLFDRDRSRVEPTPIGARFIERARLLLNQARDLEQDMSQMLGLEVGLLRLGAGPYPAEMSVARSIGRLVQRHPRLLVDFAISDWPGLTRRVLEGDIELAVADTSLALADDRLIVEALPRHQLQLFCRAGHPLAGKPSLDLAEARSYPLVGNALPPHLVNLSAQDNRGLRASLPEGTTAPEIRVDSFALILPIVLESDALSTATAVQLEPWLRNGQLRVLPFRANWLRLNYGFITLRDRMLSPAAELFMRLVRQIETEVAARNRELTDGLLPPQTPGNRRHRSGEVT